MKKTLMKDIKKDKGKIIKDLRKNSKETIDVMARRNGRSRQTIWRMIKDLEKKIIWGYTIVFSRELLDLKHFIITMDFNTKPLSEKFRLEKIQRTISEELEKQMKNISLDCFYFAHGPHDIFIEISAKGIKDAVNARNFICREIGDCIKDITVSEILFNLVENGIRNPEIKKFKDFYRG